MAETHEAHTTLVEALAAAQAEFPAIPKTATANTGTYGYRYAPLDVVLSAVRPALARHGIATTFTTRVEGDRLYGVGELLCGDERRVSELPLPEPGADWRKWGAAHTYARRYTLLGLLDIAAEDDTDAESATQSAPGRASARAQASTPKPDAITEKQRRYLFARSESVGMQRKALRDLIVEITGQESTLAIRPDQYDKLIKAIEESDGNGATATAEDAARPLTGAQRSKLHALASEAGLSRPEYANRVRAVLGQDAIEWGGDKASAEQAGRELARVLDRVPADRFDDLAAVLQAQVEQLRVDPRDVL